MVELDMENSTLSSNPFLSLCCKRVCLKNLLSDQNSVFPRLLLKSEIKMRKEFYIWSLSRTARDCGQTLERSG